MTDRCAGWLLLASLLAMAGAAAAADSNKNVCVPGADGRWNCGSADQPPVAAALPERPGAAASAAVPPVLLMDPNRFRVSDPLPAALAASDPGRDEPAAPAATPPPSPSPRTVVTAAPVARTPPPVAVRPASSVPAPRPVVTPAPTGNRNQGLRDFATVGREGYTLQLAAAQSPDGFLRRLGELRIPAEQAFAVPVQRNGAAVWLLCTGEYVDARSAMAAAPGGAAGAFAKPLAQLHTESGR